MGRGRGNTAGTRYSSPRRSKTREYYETSMLGVRVRVVESRNSKKMVRLYKKLQQKQQDLRLIDNPFLIYEPREKNPDKLKQDIKQIKEELDSMRVVPRDKTDQEYLKKYNDLLDKKRKEVIESASTKKKRPSAAFSDISVARQIKKIDNEQMKIKSGAKVIDAEHLGDANQEIEIS